MKNFKKLSREELKNTFGGQSCSIAIQGSDGSWTTRSGTCKTLTAMAPSLMGGVIVGYPVASYSYCETGLGNIRITSNGGSSRCN